MKVILSIALHYASCILSNHRCLVTPTLSQYISIGQTLHLGEIGRHRCCPNDTKRSLYSIQYFLGSFFLSDISVSSGVLVFMYPSLLDILWTCVSTQIPAFPKPTVTTRFAVFLPTPFNFKSSSKSSG